MTINITAPKLGIDSTPIKISKWLIPVGDEVKKFTPVVQVETDSIIAEINAPASGILLEQLAPEGAVVTAGAVLGQIRKSLNDDNGELPFESKHKMVKAVIGTLGLLFLLALIVAVAVLVVFFASRIGI